MHRKLKRRKICYFIQRSKFPRYGLFDHICIIKYSYSTNYSIQIKTNVPKIVIRQYLLMMMLHMHYHLEHPNYCCKNLEKHVSRQHILPARFAQMLKAIQIAATIRQPILTMFNSKLFRQAYFSNQHTINKYQIGYKHLQNNCKMMQLLHYPIVFWDHLVFGLLEVVVHSSRG